MLSRSLSRSRLPTNLRRGVQVAVRGQGTSSQSGTTFILASGPVTLARQWVLGPESATLLLVTGATEGQCTVATGRPPHRQPRPGRALEYTFSGGSAKNPGRDLTSPES
jgi:hypothetical protein